MNISFVYPNYLVFLLVIPLIIFIHFYGLKSKKKSALKFANFEAMARIKGIDLYSKSILGLIFASLICLFLVLGLSGLTIHKDSAILASSVVIAIDSSTSMQANDFNPSRIDVAKQRADDFVDSLGTGTRMGVISFSGSSFIEQPITDEKILVKNAIDNIQLSYIGGTDFYDVIISSTNLLVNEPSKAVVLISDGQINVGNISEAIDYANKYDVIFYTYGIGTEEGGNTSYGVSKLDEDSLKALAYNTQGQYFRITDEGSFRDSLNNVLNLKLQKVSINISRYCLIIALILFLIYFFLINTRFRFLPEV